MALTAPAPDPAAAAPVRRRVGAQLRMELLLTLRRGESVLLAFLIPLLILVFFSLVDVLPTGGADEPVDFLLPSTLALSVLSTAMTGLAIATGFERSTGVLKRLAVTPLRRRDLIAAKLATVLLVEALQVVVLLLTGLALGWDPSGGLGVALLGMVLGSVAFAGLGMLMAGTLPALTTLALANAVHVALLFAGGLVVPLEELPSALRVVARALPVGALSDITHGALDGSGTPGRAWLVLLAWAVVAPALAAWRFRWE